MDAFNLKSSLFVYIWALVLAAGVLASYPGSLPSSEALHETEWGKDDVSENVEELPWQINYRTELLREMSKLARSEEDIVSKINSLTSQRQSIRAQKRGHVQCFLNLVSCYRKRRR